MKKVLDLVLCFCLIVGLAACGNATGKSAGGGGKLKFAMIDRNTGNPYTEKQLSGFKEAVEELGYEAIINAPEAPTAEAQIQMIEDIINQNVSAIAVVCNDPDALAPVLKKAMGDQCGGTATMLWPSTMKPAQLCGKLPD